MCLPGGVCDNQRNMNGRRTVLLQTNRSFLSLVPLWRPDHVPHHCATVPDGCASSHCTKKHLPGERQHPHEDEVEDPVQRDIPNTDNHITHQETKQRKAHPHASEAFQRHNTAYGTAHARRRVTSTAQALWLRHVHQTSRSATRMYWKARPDPATAHEKQSENKQRNKEEKIQPKRFRGVYPPPK